MKQRAEEEFPRGMALPRDCEPASRYKICCGTEAPGVEGSTACVIMGCPRHLGTLGSTGTHPSIGIPMQHPTQGDGLSDVKQGCWAQPFWTSNMAPTGTQGYPTRGGGPHETPPTSSAGAKGLGTAELLSE